jgi:hypothetical protein
MFQIFQFLIVPGGVRFNLVFSHLYVFLKGEYIGQVLPEECKFILHGILQLRELIWVGEVRRIGITQFDSIHCLLPDQI